jgi:hypothetical protein
MHASLTSAKQEINKKQRNTQVETTDVRSDSSPFTDSLPVACCLSEQQLFLTHSLFFSTLQIHTIVLWQRDNANNDGKGDAEFFSHTLFCFLALNRFTWYHAWQG